MLLRACQQLFQECVLLILLKTISIMEHSIMESKFVFGVRVCDVVSESSVELFDSNLIDEACAFALSLFRSIQKVTLNVVVYQYSDGKDIVTFKRS